MEKHIKYFLRGYLRDRCLWVHHKGFVNEYNKYSGEPIERSFSIKVEDYNNKRGIIHIRCSASHINASRPFIDIKCNRSTFVQSVQDMFTRLFARTDINLDYDQLLIDLVNEWTMSYPKREYAFS